MRYTKIGIVAAATCLLGSAAGSGQTGQTGQTKEPPRIAKADRWEAWRPLVGTWEGSSEGEPGKGSVKLDVGFVMNERFLKLATVADYRNDKGQADHHEDFGFLSFDGERSKFVFRQFHLEGFVNQYTLTSDPKADVKFELTTEKCENTPPGWRARETYRVSGDTLQHTFELAGPDKPFQRYTKATLKRQK